MYFARLGMIYIDEGRVSLIFFLFNLFFFFFFFSNFFIFPFSLSLSLFLNPSTTRPLEINKIKELTNSTFNKNTRLFLVFFFFPFYLPTHTWRVFFFHWSWSTNLPSLLFPVIMSSNSFLQQQQFSQNDSNIASMPIRSKEDLYLRLSVSVYSTLYIFH